jgi:DNA polymerase-3 subunit delta
MSHQKIIESIRKKEYKPVYFLHGVEPFFIDEITKVFEEEILSEAEKSFNFTVFYGKDSNFRQIRDTASRFPMMASHQVVIIKEAQEMKSLNDLKAYIERAAPTTILLICHKYKKYDMRSAFGKALKKTKVEIFESKKFYDNQIPQWTRDYLSSQGYEIKSDALDMMTEHLGADLSKIANEVKKLAINVPKGTKLTTKHIQDNVGISKDFNVFELQEAIGIKNALKAHRIVNHFAKNTKKYPLMMTLASLYGFFSKLYIAASHARSTDLDMAKALGITFRDPKKAQYAAKFRVEKFRKSIKHYSKSQIEGVFSVLKEYDLKYKGVDNTGTPEGELLKEMVVKIFHA